MNTETTAKLEELKRAATALAVVLPSEDGTEFELERMRVFLARVVIAPATAIKITDTPETDENTDLIKSYHVENIEGGGKRTVIEMLDKLQAGEILRLIFDIKEGHPDAAGKLLLARTLYASYIAERQLLYP